MRAYLILVGMAAALAASPAYAKTLRFTAALTGAAETPPKAVPGRGDAAIALDTAAKTLSWSITYSGLTGPATMAHFHGPAVTGVAAGVQVPLTGDLASPIKGKAVLTDTQIGDLEAGKWYVNIHTAANPGGELRGQVEAAH